MLSLGLEENENNDHTKPFTGLLGSSGYGNCGV